MNLMFPRSKKNELALEIRLLRAAALFMFFYSLAITLAPAARSHSWDVSYRWHHWIGFAAWLICFSVIHRALDKWNPRRDVLLLPLVSLLVGWGLLTIWRLSDNFGFRQTVWMLVGSAAIILLVRFPAWLEYFRRYKYLSLVLGLLLVGLTFFIGRYPQGTGPALWLGARGLYFQPSEPLKLFIILFLSAYLSEKLFVSMSFKQLLTPTVLLVVISIAILIAQRDMGTALLVLILFTLIVYLSIGRRRVLGTALLLLFALGIFAYIYSPVIHNRILSWLNPWKDPAGASYQIVQSLIAAASGGIFGTGPGMGSPGLVPLSHSDFIASTILEETGLLGFSALILTYAFIFLRALQIGLHSRSNYKRFLAASIGIYIATQSLLIIGGNLRLLPLTGVTLPFMSYGGSSLVISMIAAGILILVSDQRTDLMPNLPRLRPYRILGGLVCTAFFAVILTAGWYGVVKAESLQARTDNIRWTVNARFIPRGSILDRSNAVLAETTGTPGTLKREITYPPLSNTIGYANLQFGKSSLELLLDPYLTGTTGSQLSTSLYHKLIYSQPPQGLNVRLAIDLALQKTSDNALGKHLGAVVALNSKTGEILALSSSPSFDANNLEAGMPAWKDDQSAPLLNRATQGQYPLGTALTTFLSAASSTTLITTGLTDYTYAGEKLNCTVDPVSSSYESAVAAGCPGTLAALAGPRSPSQINAILTNLGFFELPPLISQAGPSLKPADWTEQGDFLFGKDQVLVSPVQTALAAAQISQAGVRPTPRLASAVEIPGRGWVILPTAMNPQPAMGIQLSTNLQLRDNPELPAWESVGSAITAENRIVTWYITSTKASWQGNPVTVVVLIEEDNPSLAIRTGRTILADALSSND